MKSRITYSLLLMLLLSSCSLYSRYQRPDVLQNEENLYRNMENDSVNTNDSTIATLSWRELFTDPMLQDWIEQGLENNTNLQIAHLKVKEAEATLQASRLALLPSVSFSAQANMNSYNANKASITYTLAPSAEWELDIFGKMQNTKRAAQAALKQSQAYEQAVKTELIATIANSYYTLLMLDEQLLICQNTLRTWDENIRTMSALKRAGKTNEAAVLQAKANRLQVEGSMLTLEKQVQEQENSLFALLGIAPQPMNRGKMESQQFPRTLSIGIPLEVLSQRPDVRQAEFALEQAFYATNAARASFYPNITLGGTAGWTNNAGSAILNPGSWLLSAIGSLIQPIFNQGKLKAQLKIAQAQQEEALLQFKQSLLDAGTEVNNALILWQTAQKRLNVDKKQIMTLRAAVWNTQLLMKHSSTNYLEVLTAQQNLLEAELVASSDKYDEIQGIITLYRALGGGSE